MKNTIKVKAMHSITVIRRIAGIISMALVIGVSFAALSLTGCDNGGGGGGGTGDPIANHITGTWTADDGEEITFSGSSFEKTENNKAVARGTYTTTARTITANITMAVKEVHGDALSEIEEGPAFESKWYTKNQVVDAFRKWAKEEYPSFSDDKIEDILADQSGEFDDMFPTMTGTVDDNTMTVDGTKYRKAGGTTNPGGGGEGGTLSGTYYYSSDSSRYFTFTTGGSVTFYSEAGTISGTYTVSGTQVTLTFPNYNAIYMTIVNSTTLKDSSGNLWTVGGGMTWRSATNPFYASYSSVSAITYGNGKFVAVGDNGKMAYSADGVTWTAVADSTFGTNGISDIAYGNGKFVAVGSNDKMAYSSDGINWTAVAGSTFSYISDFKAIAFGNGKFVAGAGSSVATSSDGITWTAAVNSPFNNWIYAIAYGGNRFVAGGSGGKTAYSSDGSTWTAVPPGTMWDYDDGGTKYTSDIEAIAYGDGKFVAGGDVGKMATSTNGTTWTAVSNTTFSNNTRTDSRIYAIAFGNGKFVAGGMAFGAEMAISTNGTTWTAVDLRPETFGISIDAIAYGNGTWVAAGTSGRLAYSTGN